MEMSTAGSFTADYQYAPERASRLSILHLMLWALCIAAYSARAEAANGRPPNIVFFLIDDLGLMDIGAYHAQTFYETPHVDRLAREGMRFTNGYAANPVCSPTRYSIMTGKYPSRVQSTDWFSGKREGRFRPAPLNDVMALEEITLAEALDRRAHV